MNPVVQQRHNDLDNLIWYLFGPGKRDEHTDPHLIAVWDGAGDMAKLEPPIGPGGKRDVRTLIELLAQPLHAARNPPKWTVWHCPISAAPEDRLLTDAEWAEIAREVMDATGLAPFGDRDAVRWIAVRHADNHIHLAATLVRQDGRTAWGWQDKIKSRRRCYELEVRFGLRRVGPMDRTGHRRPSAAEINKAKRLGRALPARDELRRDVRAAAVAAANEDEFFARLADAGVLVKLRESVTNPGEITGYAVALATHTTADGEPVWFSGGKLARDLTLPKLRQQWARPDGHTAAADAPVRISPAARAQALETAAQAIRGAADAIGDLAGENPQAAQAIAQAASDTLTAVAAAVEGRRGGPVTRAAELFDRAAREPGGLIAKANQRSYDLRAMSRLVHLMGRISGDTNTFAMLSLLLDLARLSDTLAALREAQQRYHQAEAAVQAATILRAAANATGRIAPTPAIPANLADLTDADTDLTATPATPPLPELSTPDSARASRPGR
ncbi:MAG: hypothetical protein QOE61_5792 [Micromonosporaceae bacterium]|nr:hypothetical protein [Micromonosporaceae bacterium]